MRYQLQDALKNEEATRAQLQTTLTREQRSVYLERCGVPPGGSTRRINWEAWASTRPVSEQFRGWEWPYLSTLRNTKDVTFAGHTANITKIGFFPNGRVVSIDGGGVARTRNVHTAATTRGKSATRPLNHCLFTRKTGSRLPPSDGRWERGHRAVDREVQRIELGRIQPRCARSSVPTWRCNSDLGGS